MDFLKISNRQNEYECEANESQDVPDCGHVAFLICFFVLLREFHPIDSFLTSYLISPPLNFGIDQVNEQIYPFGVFASFIMAVVVFLVTDYLRYKPIIILNGIFGVLTYGLLLGKPTLSVLYVEQACYGFFFASTVASSIYLYAKVDDTNMYQNIAALVQTCVLFGQFFRGVFSQLLLSFSGLGEVSLVYFSVGGLILATIWSLFIPSVGHSIYYHRVEKLDSELTETHQNVVKTKSQNVSTLIRHTIYVFKTAYANPYVLKWSIWWALSCGVYNLISTYSQVLWQTVAEENGGTAQLMNGAVDSIFTLTSALATYCVGFVKFDWKHNADFVLSIASFILAILTQVMYRNSSLLILYFMYIFFGCVHQTILTVAYSEVAQNIEKDSYALIFGFNVTATLAISYIITVVFIQGWIVLLSLKQQFLLYTLYFTAMAIFYLTRLDWRCRKSST